jgi:hypothetical protein
MIDNAGDNNIILKEIARWLLATYNIIWDADEYKFRYFRYIVSLIANAFTTNKLLKVTCVLHAPKGTPKEKKPI